MKPLETDKHAMMAISRFNLSDNNSLPNVCPEAVLKALRIVPSRYFNREEHTLKDAIKEKDMDLATRISFWAEYHRSRRENARMRIGHICKNGMCEQDFRRKLNNFAWVAYICIEPPRMAFLNEAIVRRAYTRAREILDLHPYNLDIVEDFEDGKLKKRKTKKSLNPVFAKLQLAMRETAMDTLPSEQPEEDEEEIKDEKPEIVDDTPPQPIETPEQEWARLQEEL